MSTLRIVLFLTTGTLLAQTGCLNQSKGPGEWSSKQRSATAPVVPGPPPATSVTVAPAAGIAPTATPNAPTAPFAVIAGDSRTAAVSILQHAADSPSALLRSHAIESLAPDAEAARAAIQRGLVDPNRGVRFASAMAVGEHRLCELSLLVEPLLHDESMSVRAAAIFALNTCGRAADPTPLAAMMLSDDPEVRGNAAVVLGEMGNPTAVPLLQASLGRGMALVSPARVRVVELQVAEAQVRLGEASAADPIRAALFAPPDQAELVVLACQIAGRIRDQGAVSSLRRLIEADGNDQRPPEIRLAAMSAMGELGAPVGDVLPELAALAASERPDLRAQTAGTLGRTNDQRALPLAIRMMSDRDPIVQVAAAGAVLRLTAGPTTDATGS